MESLNLNTLANSLPTSNLASAEAELLNNFRAAALSITTLYRSSRTTSKRAYNSGYAAACHDLLQMIQQGVSDSETEGGSGVPTIGRVMDWIEGRLEAIRAREEEEDEDEERDKEREKTKEQLSKTKATLARASSAPVVPQHKDTAAPLRPSKLSQTITAQSTPSSPPAPSPRALPPSISRAPKSRASTSSVLKELPRAPAAVTVSAPVTSAPSPAPDSVFAFHAPLSPASALVEAAAALAEPHSHVLNHNLAAGAKRRHAVMMMLDAAPAEAVDAAQAPNPVAGSSRRRTRSSRGASLQAQGQNQNQYPPVVDAMDVEEDGRDRKRVARR